MGEDLMDHNVAFARDREVDTVLFDFDGMRGRSSARSCTTLRCSQPITRRASRTDLSTGESFLLWTRVVEG